MQLALFYIWATPDIQKLKNQQLKLTIYSRYNLNNSDCDSDSDNTIIDSDNTVIDESDHGSEIEHNNLPWYIDNCITISLKIF